MSVNLIKLRYGEPIKRVIDEAMTDIRTPMFIEFPNGKKASSLIDAFIEATGTAVEDYVPTGKSLDVLA